MPSHTQGPVELAGVVTSQYLPVICLESGEPRYIKIVGHLLPGSYHPKGSHWCGNSVPRGPTYSDKD